jgi:DNA-binding Lrp family transcriptional regulator
MQIVQRIVAGDGGRVMRIDELDVRLLDLLAAEPRVGVLEASRRLRVARGTVQARLDKMQHSGVIRDLAPTVDPAALGYPVTAFLSLEIAQHQGRGAVVAHLQHIEEVIEAHTITGSADLLVRLVARDNTDLQRVIDEVVADRSVLRAATVISLTTEIAHRTGPLVHAAALHDRDDHRPGDTRVSERAGSHPNGGHPADGR